MSYFYPQSYKIVIKSFRLEKKKQKLYIMLLVGTLKHTQNLIPWHAIMIEVDVRNVNCIKLAQRVARNNGNKYFDVLSRRRT